MLIACAAAGLSVTVYGAKPGNGSSAGTREKARYYYMEAVRRQVDGNNAAAFELYKKAYGIDPTYTEAESAYGGLRLTIAADTFQTPAMLLGSLEMMRPFIDKYTGDYFEQTYYAYLAAHLDTLKEAIRVYERADSLFPSKTATLANLSEAYMAHHDLASAIGALDRYERVEGKSAPVSLRKITYFIQAQDTLGALREARELAEYSPREPRFMILRGNVYDALAMPDSALTCYLQAERIAPESGPAKLALAGYYKEHGDSVNFDKKTYEALLSEDFDLTQKADLLAQYLQRIISDKSDTSRGDHLFDVLSKQYPHEPQVLDLAARYSAAKGNMADAIEQIGYAIDLKADQKDYWAQLMSYQMVDDKPAEAIKTFDRAATHITPDEDLLLMLTQAGAMAKDYDRAEDAFNKLLGGLDTRLNITDSLPDRSIAAKMTFEDLNKTSSLFTMLGDLYYTRKMIPQAFVAYENALKFIPDNAMALNNYAYFMSEEGGDLDRALQMSSQAIQIEPDNYTFLDTYAWIQFLKGNVEEALKYQMSAVEKAEAAEDISAELYSHLGDILFNSARPDEALDAWKKAAELNPEDALLKKKIKAKMYFPKE